jgi:hypothetical protein
MPSNDSKKAQLGEEDGGNNLDRAHEDALIDFLMKNWDMFAWKPSNMLGIRESH